jgi:hypothetical protein
MINYQLNVIDKPVGHRHILDCRNWPIPSLTVVQEEPVCIFLGNFTRKCNCGNL